MASLTVAAASNTPFGAGAVIKVLAEEFAEGCAAPVVETSWGATKMDGALGGAFAATGMLFICGIK